MEYSLYRFPSDTGFFGHSPLRAGVGTTIKSRLSPTLTCEIRRRRSIRIVGAMRKGCEDDECYFGPGVHTENFGGVAGDAATREATTRLIKLRIPG